MEIRAIDANALFDALYDNEFQTFCPLDEVSDVIDAAPTLDYEPVRHGEWVESTVCVGFYECSQCRSRKRGNQPFFDSVWNYCPNCGAKMGKGGMRDG